MYHPGEAFRNPLRIKDVSLLKSFFAPLQDDLSLLFLRFDARVCSTAWAESESSLYSKIVITVALWMVLDIVTCNSSESASGSIHTIILPALSTTVRGVFILMVPCPKGPHLSRRICSCIEFRPSCIFFALHSLVYSRKSQSIYTRIVMFSSGMMMCIRQIFAWSREGCKADLDSMFTSSE